MKDSQKFTPKYWVGRDKGSEGVFLPILASCIATFLWVILFYSAMWVIE